MAHNLRHITHADGSVHKRNLNWRPSPHDPALPHLSIHAEHPLLAEYHATKTLPTHADLTPRCSKVRDQRSLGACTSFGVSCPIEMLEKHPKDTVPSIQMSTLFQYQVSLIDEGVFPEDDGDTITGAVRSATLHGVLLETDYPYVIENLPHKPSAALMAKAKKELVKSNHKVADGDLTTIKSLLAAGYPIVFGFQVPESFETQEFSANPILKRANILHEKLVGGHCVVIVGFSDSDKLFKIRNSWGEDWGDGGYWYADYAFVGDSKYCSDFRCIEASPLVAAA